MHNAVYRIGPEYLQECISLRSTPHSTRQSEAPVTNATITNSRRYGDRAFSNAGPKMWNSLPNDIRNISNSVAFKKTLKTFLFT